MIGAQAVAGIERRFLDRPQEPDRTRLAERRIFAGSEWITNTRRCCIARSIVVPLHSSDASRLLIWSTITSQTKTGVA